jgi:hypothetical protein
MAMWPSTTQLSIYSMIGLGGYVAAVAYIAKRQRQAVLARLRGLALVPATFEHTCWAVDEALRREYNWVSSAVGFPLVLFGCLLAWPLVVLGTGVSALVTWTDARRSG